MPIEIRELVIRAYVDPAEEDPLHDRAPPGEGHRQPPAPDELVQTCVREVLRILEEKRER